jgi:hypothetical protein
MPLSKSKGKHSHEDRSTALDRPTAAIELHNPKADRCDFHDYGIARLLL